MKRISLQTIKQKAFDFTSKVFKGQTMEGKANHLIEEAGEVKEAFVNLQNHPTNNVLKKNLKEEVVDCFLIALDMASHAKMSTEELLERCDEKLEINLARTWKQNAEGYYHHEDGKEVETREEGQFVEIRDLPVKEKQEVYKELILGIRQEATEAFLSGKAMTDNPYTMLGPMQEWRKGYEEASKPSPEIVCNKTGKPCDYGCSGLCKESC